MKHQISETTYLPVGGWRLWSWTSGVCILPTVPLLLVVDLKRWHLYFNMKPSKCISTIGISKVNIAQMNSTYSPDKSSWGQERNYWWAIICGEIPYVL